ncbi:PDZ domain-containing protein, partial [Frankia sp. Cpl3]|nr:PDZ domain-containing protein [Frankia sp. Cpl3]
MVLERQLFSVRIQSPLAQTIRSIGMGLVGGLIVSVLAGGLGIVVQVPSLWILWILAVCLALIKLRFLCFAYAAGLLTILHGIARVFPEGAGDQGLGMLLSWLRDADPVPILALDALLHLVEAMLVRWNAGRDASPLFIEGRRGRIIGAYQLQSFWLTPLFLLVQTTPESGMTGMLYPGWPLFANDVAAFGIMFLPAVTGFSDITQTMTPWRKARDIAKQLVLYAVILLALAYLSVLWPPLSLAAALFALFGHEGLFWLSRRAERQQTPYFIQSSSGVKIMAVIPGTPAEEMGILPGEIVVKVNGYQ